MTECCTKVVDCCCQVSHCINANASANASTAAFAVGILVGILLVAFAALLMWLAD